MAEGGEKHDDINESRNVECIEPTQEPSPENDLELSDISRDSYIESGNVKDAHRDEHDEDDSATTSIKANKWTAIQKAFQRVRAHTTQAYGKVKRYPSSKSKRERNVSIGKNVKTSRSKSKRRTLKSNVDTDEILAAIGLHEQRELSQSKDKSNIPDNIASDKQHVRNGAKVYGSSETIDEISSIATDSIRTHQKPRISHQAKFTKLFIRNAFRSLLKSTKKENQLTSVDFEKNNSSTDEIVSLGIKYNPGDEVPTRMESIDNDEVDSIDNIPHRKTKLTCLDEIVFEPRPSKGDNMPAKDKNRDFKESKPKLLRSKSLAVLYGNPDTDIGLYDTSEKTQKYDNGFRTIFRKRSESVSEIISTKLKKGTQDAWGSCFVDDENKQAKSPVHKTNGKLRKRSSSLSDAFSRIGKKSQQKTLNTKQEISPSKSPIKEDRLFTKIAKTEPDLLNITLETLSNGIREYNKLTGTDKPLKDSSFRHTASVVAMATKWKRKINQNKSEVTVIVDDLNKVIPKIKQERLFTKRMKPEINLAGKVKNKKVDEAETKMKPFSFAETHIKAQSDDANNGLGIPQTPFSRSLNSLNSIAESSEEEEDEPCILNKSLPNLRMRSPLSSPRRPISPLSSPRQSIVKPMLDEEMLPTLSEELETNRMRHVASMAILAKRWKAFVGKIRDNDMTSQINKRKKVLPILQQTKPDDASQHHSVPEDESYVDAEENSG
ncbi:unnamed protein product [Owenia fusiformis]|uniref:Uncharacterized protein n=1 Tax=Owenia fusiformis TaxID=6347 RepID=A0A8J1V0H8_OWEFU|nr:unnamed protein product [Owenia fusiformis]